MNAPVTLREVRLWHWKKVISARKTAEKFDRDAEEWEKRYLGKRSTYSRRMAVQNHSRANWHLKAVQVLNDLFPLGDTAERDLEIENAVLRKQGQTRK